MEERGPLGPCPILEGTCILSDNPSNALKNPGSQASYNAVERQLPPGMHDADVLFHDLSARLHV